MTLLEMLTKAAGYLAEKGVDNGRLDAEVLLADLLGIQRLDLYLQFDRPVQSHEQDAYRERVRRRAAHEPVAYITSKKEFWSMMFEVNPHVLVPRPDTETVVERGLELITEDATIAEVGIGSGCISCAIASDRPNVRIFATDISADAAAVAARNVGALGFGDRISIQTGSLLAPVAAAGPFQLVISNPPYVKTDDVTGDLEHEPRVALDGGADGLMVYRALIEEAAAHLEPGGFLVLEVGFDTAVGVCSLLESAGGFTQITLHRDRGGIDRVAVAQRQG